MAIFRRRSTRAQRKSKMCIAGLDIAVTRKTMKYLRLKISPPDGAVSISVPHATSNANIEAMVRERLVWIKEQRQNIRSRPSVPEPQITTGECYSLWGQTYSLEIKLSASRIPAQHIENKIVLYCRADDNLEQRRLILESFYRQQLQQVLPELAENWQVQVKKRAQFWGIKKMKTRWGSCNTQRARIWINLELAKYPRECLEYVVVHELVHLYEANHSHRFYALLDKFMPGWEKWHRHLKHGEL
ncbi:M48 family metallopeptidase [Teredinibacter haidensis]|uniref:M48 family metallopeptidase n=1 Tax=Teredinibacter haidensis TaxID=2731755 RepID=UPI0009FA20D9|nr:SprT family zinc-dependent metalloprotease [Teredinibacter haidensis]